MIATLLGKKIGMTQIYDAQNVLIPVTVVEAGPCPVVQVKTVESDGYYAVRRLLRARGIGATFVGSSDPLAFVSAVMSAPETTPSRSKPVINTIGTAGFFNCATANNLGTGTLSSQAGQISGSRSAWPQ